MQLFKRMLVATAMLISTSNLAAVDTNEINERDIQAVDRFVEGKREIPTDEKGDELSISGQVRFEYQHKEEKINGEKQRGSGSGVDGCMSKGTNEYDVEVNFTMDYRAECTWAAIKIAFDNDAGVSASCGDEECGSGVCDSICLEQAYMGYRVWEGCDGELNLELGRRKMYTVFDSKVQFNHRFDGLLAHYTQSFEDIGNFYLKGGIFVIDSVIDNYGYGVELGLGDIMDSGVTVKYSFIDWTKGRDRCGETSLEDSVCRRMWNYQNSQVQLSYEFCPGIIDQKVKVYGAFLYNHAAKRRPETDSKENIAWYVGLSVGKVKFAGDWSLDFGYQHVEAQAVSDKDSGGIGRGNVNKDCFAAETNNRGNTNFHGFLIEGLYGITDNLTILGEFEWSSEVTKALGGDIDYKKYEVELIYAF